MAPALDVGVAVRPFAERSRRLTVTDPQGRQLMISCGAALHHARTALAAAGWDAHVTRLPDTRRPDLLATLTVAKVGEFVGCPNT